MATEFVVPKFLENRSIQEVHDEMLSSLPDDLDCSEGQHVYNFTRPTALEIAKVCQYILPEVIKLIFPQWSYGEYLTAHAETRGIVRKSATYAYSYLIITGDSGTYIPVGSIFSTKSISDVSAVKYETTEAVTIPDSGQIQVSIHCTETGTISNTKADTIIMNADNIKGIKNVTNPEDVTGGTDEEDEDSLRERIAEYDEAQGESFVGNDADYKRWAKSVDGVGEAIVVSAQDESGLITIILTDANGAPASDKLREDVYDYIMRPEDPLERLAPPNALLQVVAPDTLMISIAATIELADGYTIEAVQESFLRSVVLYLATAAEENEVKYTKIASILSATTGVSDFKELLINGDTANIPIETNQLASVDQKHVFFVESTV